MISALPRRLLREALVSFNTGALLVVLAAILLFTLGGAPPTPRHTPRLVLRIGLPVMCLEPPATVAGAVAVQRGWGAAGCLLAATCGAVAALCSYRVQIAAGRGEDTRHG